MPLVSVEDYIDADLTHSVHTSGRKSFRGCRRRWNWIFNEFWYPTTSAKPLEFGVAFHTAMETLYAPLLWDKPRDIVLEMSIQAFRNECEKQFEKYLTTLGPDAGVRHADPTVVADYEERKALGEEMLRYHHEKVMPELDYNKFIPYKVEIPFEVPITNPETSEQLWCKCKVCWERFKAYTVTLQDGIYLNRAGYRTNLLGITPEVIEHGTGLWHEWQGLPVTYGGRVDALFIDEKGGLWVVDWKTAAMLIKEQDREELLLLDDQITSYCWAFWTLGIKVEGFIYHEMKKSLLAEPEPLRRRYKDRLYSCNKQNPTTYDLFLGTVRENDVEAYEAGLYDEYLGWLKENSTRFHARYQQHRTEYELVQAGINIYNEACDMTDPNLRIYPNGGRFNCNNCAFRQPCIGQNRGEDYLYTLSTQFDKRRYHYWEERYAQPSTDSRGNQ
jgi:hypothetical protein